MNSFARGSAWRYAVAAMLVVAIAGACSRKRPPATGTTIDTGAADTAGMTRPGEPERVDATLRERLDAARTTMADPIYFDFDRSEIKPEYREVLARKAAVMNEFPEITIRIEGHCDERGTVEYNLALGERRAQAAKDYLVNAGIDPDRISTISYGEEQPAVDESNESAWAQNRRDEFVITAMVEGAA